MLVTKVSPISGKKNTMEVDCTQEQLNIWSTGELIQNALPDASSTQREFLISGMSEEEQKEIFE